jgi:hypothetical protein
MRFLECQQNGGVVDDENGALDLVALCGENEVSTVLLYQENLSPAFFDLKSGQAGRILLKFINYSVKVAAIISPEISNQGRFYEMVLETNRGNDFRIFSNRSEAVEWIRKINY